MTIESLLPRTAFISVDLPDPKSNDERLSSLEQLASLVENRSLNDYEFKRATGSLTQDVKFISGALLRDPNSWRMNRAFHAVHVRTAEP